MKRYSYSVSNGRYWFIWLFCFIYYVGTMIWISLFVQNVSPVYTYFASPGEPGKQLVSYRMTFASIATQINIFGQIFIIPFIMMAVYFRDSYGCSIFWYIMFAICVFFCFLCMAALGQQYGSSNRQKSFGNLANDLQYCCAFPGDGCPNTFPCTDPPKQPNELSPNGDFLGLFWTNFIFFIFDLIFIGFLVYETWYAKDVILETEEDTTPAPPPPPATATAGALVVRTGLRNRK